MHKNSRKGRFAPCGAVLLAAALGSAALLVALAGCAKKEAREGDLTMWTFVDLHAKFYEAMAERWNEDHPDRQLHITFTNMPYGEMHNKVTMAVQTGKGAPDLVDIEIGQFPNFLKGTVPFLPLNEYLAPYEADVVKSRLEIYGKDGVYYGVPTHVGAMVMYYNTALLEAAGIDYKTIVTWDDFTAAGKKYRAATGKTLTTVDTGGTDWLSLAMAEYGQDWTDEAGRADIKIPSVKKMIEMQAGWIRDGIAACSPGGHIDMETGFANLTAGELAAFPKALWFMSRFVNYMPEMAGVWAIAPCPVFEPGQPRSVGVGGTGTVIFANSKSAALAAEFMAWAKLSWEGNVRIWEELGFDPCNTKVWTDTNVTGDASNKFIAYFKTNPFDTLNQIRNEIGKIRVTQMSPVIGEQMNINVLVGVLQDGGDLAAALSEAQAQIDLEQ
ncbi:MAG: extracellular solute-binding protein [Treponema sp.]|jgi:arabinosaccharide transport system substrate-binding protein|nr:extracellular solute-binding protein [Treponema sp.]